MDTEISVDEAFSDSIKGNQEPLEEQKEESIRLLPQQANPLRREHLVAFMRGLEETYGSRTHPTYLYWKERIEKKYKKYGELSTKNALDKQKNL